MKKLLGFMGVIVAIFSLDKLVVYSVGDKTQGENEIGVEQQVLDAVLKSNGIGVAEKTSVATGICK